MKRFYFIVEIIDRFIERNFTVKIRMKGFLNNFIAVFIIIGNIAHIYFFCSLSKQGNVILTAKKIRRIFVSWSFHHRLDDTSSL